MSVDIGAVVAAVSGAITIGSKLLQAGQSIAPLAEKVVETLKPKTEEITQADLDAMATASDLTHEKIQEPIPPEEPEDGGAKTGPT